MCALFNNTINEDLNLLISDMFLKDIVLTKRRRNANYKITCKNNLSTVILDNVLYMSDLGGQGSTTITFVDGKTIDVTEKQDEIWSMVSGKFAQKTTPNVILI